MSNAEGDLTSVQEEVKAVDHNLQIVQRQRHDLESGIDENISQETTSSKAAKNLVKESAALQDRIHAKEVEASQMQNELARIKVDSLNTDAHNVQLRETLEKLVNE